MAAGRPGGPPDIAQMLERLPALKLEDLKTGDTVVISSTKGAKEGEITAITLLANAGMLIQMASTQAGRGPGGPGANAGPGLGMNGLSMGGGGFDLPGMMP